MNGVKDSVLRVGEDLLADGLSHVDHRLLLRFGACLSSERRRDLYDEAQNAHCDAMFHSKTHIFPPWTRRLTFVAVICGQIKAGEGYSISRLPGVGKDREQNGKLMPRWQ
jgi:hypothetical protein